MAHEHIPKEFYDGVERVARQVSAKWPTIEWEDTRQDIWVELLSSDSLLDTALESEDPSPIFRMLASRTISNSFQRTELAQGSYVYGTKDIRALLESGIIQNPTEFTVTQSTQVSEAMLKLLHKNKDYFNTIVDRFVHGIKTPSQATTRAVDKLSDFINWQASITDANGHEGPGSRKVVSNAQSTFLTSASSDEKTPSWAVKFVGKKPA